MGSGSAAAPGDCPVTEDVSDRLLRLPFYNELTQQDSERIVEAIHGFADRVSCRSTGTPWGPIARASHFLWYLPFVMFYVADF